MKISLWGPPQVSRTDGPIHIGARKQRLLLAVLALEVNNLVSVERLIDMLWPRNPPATARGMIHTYVSGLRKILMSVGGRDNGVWVHRQDSGYMLKCHPEYIDLCRFKALTASARRCADDESKVSLLNEALSLWRGPVLDGLLAEEARAQLCRSLDEARLTASEERIEAVARLGRHDGLLDELLALTGEQPMRPRLISALMRELHRVGRSAEALEVFQQHLALMRDELGMDPPETLRELQLAILRNHPLPVVPAAPTTSASVPRQLPKDLPTFTGRTAELIALAAVEPPGGTSPGNVAIHAIDGMAGVGKTALAIHFAHRLADRFVDGQLFVDLHGYTQGVPPVDPADALGELLQALGIPGPQVPRTLDARASLFRTLLADKRVLVVLDNAPDEDHVQPLLPGAAGCLVLTTSRMRLSGLVDAQHLSLGVLPAADARTLFIRIAGGHHPREAVEEIIELCGQLPLAIRIAAARLCARRMWTAAHLAQRLGDRHHRLAELSTGHQGVAAAIDLSSQQLSSAQRRTYRLLGLHPGVEFDMNATAALSNAVPRDADRLLESLVDAHLMEEVTPGRYRFHDLIRAHAAQTAERDEPVSERESAISRLLDFYACTASLAIDVAYPHNAGRRSPTAPFDVAIPPFDRPRDASSWLDVELATLLAIAALAAKHGRPEIVFHLSATLHGHLRVRGRYTDGESLHARALEMARMHGHVLDEIGALNRLGNVLQLQTQYERAIDCYERARQLASRTGAGGEHGEAMLGLGYIHYLQGHYEPAAAHLEQALQLAQGDPVRELYAQSALSHLDYTANRLPRAAAHFHRALQIAREIGHRIMELDALRGLGNVHKALGQPENALEYYQLGLRVAGEIGHVHGRLTAFRGLGHVHEMKGEHGEAADCFQQSLDLAVAIGDRNSQFEAMLGLGLVHQAQHRSESALVLHHNALDIALDLAQRDDQARACNGLAHVYAALGRHDLARQYWHKALDMLAALGIERIEEINEELIRSNLADLDL